MKRFTKKFLSVMLVIVLSLSSAYSANAASTISNEKNINTNSYIEEIEDGKIYIEHQTDKDITILTNEKKHIIDMSIKYFNEPNKVYAWSITNFSIDNFAENNTNF